MPSQDSRQQTADSPERTSDLGPQTSGSGSGPEARSLKPEAPLLVPLGPDEGMEALLERVPDLKSRQGRWLYWFRTACNVAMGSRCLKSRCGAVIVGKPSFELPKGTESLFGGTLLGTGFNGPPKNDPAYRRCGETTPSKAHPKAGRTCCVHAEVRALLTVPRHRLEGSTLYFARVDADGVLQPSGRPWCTECSKLALDLGVKTWVLWHADGPAEYDAAHYDWLSNRYDPLPSAAETDTEARDSR